jgi:hypothetical protein
MNSEAPLIYSIGDSISVHYGEYLQKFLGDDFRVLRRSGDRQALANLDVPAGANSGDSARVLWFLQARIAAGDFKPDLLLVNCGLHDIKRAAGSSTPQVSLGEYRSNLALLTALVRNSGVPMAWVRTTHSIDAIHNADASMGFTRLASDGEIFDAIALEVMERAQVPAINLRTFTRGLGPGEDLFCDHVHFHDSVRRLQAAYLAGWICRWFAEDP